LVTSGGTHDAGGIITADFFCSDELFEDGLQRFAARLLRCLWAALSLGSLACVLFDLSVFLIGLLAGEVTAFYGPFDPLFKVVPVGLFRFGFAIAIWALFAIGLVSMPEGCEERGGGEGEDEFFHRACR
jgi:hypothetical protein